jgi:DNA polymerase-3 subunit alpha
MAFVTLEDLYGQIEVVVFPKVYDTARLSLEINKGILVRGRASISEEEGKLLASEIQSFDQLMRQVEDESKELWLLVQNYQSLQGVKNELEQLLSEKPGRTPVYVQLKEERKRVAIRRTVHVDDSLLKRLQLEYGENSVLVREVKQQR